MKTLIENWKVPPVWDGHTCAVVAGGPSVSGQDLSLLDGLRVIAVNNSYEILPDAEFLYFHDRRWWNEYGHDGRVWSMFRGAVVTCALQLNMQVPAGRRAYLMERTRYDPSNTHGPDTGVEVRRTHLCGYDSGTQAINLAYHLGARRILLLGFDMRFVDGRAHHHADHPRASHESNYQRRFLPQFERISKFYAERGVELINTSPVSAITCLPRMSLEEAVTGKPSPVQLRGPRLVVAVDYGGVVDTAGGPVPLEWLRRLAERPRSECRVWAVGDQALCREVGVPGLSDLLVELPRAGHSIAEKWLPDPTVIKREKRVRLVDRLWPAAREKVHVGKSDVALEAYRLGWVHYSPDEFVEMVRGSEVWRERVL